MKASPAGARRLVLLRHGQTSWNAEERFQGHSDIDLDAVGLLQAERAAQTLAAIAPVAIVSSDLLRAAHTAGALSAATGVPVQVDVRLRETHGGTWEGMTAPEILASDGEAYRRWRHDAEADIAPGGGETRSQLSARAVPAVLAALAPHPAESTVVVVSHGGTIRAVLGTMLALPMQHWTAISGLANCCWSVLEAGEMGGGPSGGLRWRLVEHNAFSLPEPVHGDEH